MSFMRPWRALAALLMCSASTAAVAGVVTDTVTYDGSADFGSQLTGPLFNPALGTLTGVDLAITGSYDPKIFFPSISTTPSTDTLLDYNIFGFTGSFGNYNLTVDTTKTGNYLVGPPEAFSIGIDPKDIQDFVALGPGNHDGQLGYINVMSAPASGSWGGTVSDDSVYSGSVTITYTYTSVPEPSTLAILGAALVFLACGVAYQRRRFR